MRAIGDKAVGDLHFTKSSHETPDGDLAEYVMSLTSEDPKAAGLSIVFVRDVAAEKKFSEENTIERKYSDVRKKKRVERHFVSPDRANKKGLPHCRILQLKAADIVDEPAANPDGMFDAQPLARNADDLLSYAAGLTKEKPDATALGIDGDRASQFLGRWLRSHGLSLVRSDKQVGTAEASRKKPAASSRNVAPQPQTDASLERFDKACDALLEAYAGRDDKLSHLGTPGSP
ncbi:hypothetical protein [Rosistilla oblonga]|uniref:hypothetical protein n=1 Tax=Rosistilla oblonga TaxID=2527990 RepID=UPI0018D268A7|nr:hypothetical protein [Rosistilla oblonga]